MKKVAVSGGFDPLHIGHLKMFEESKNLGDYLVVILNGDSWLMRKKGFVFMNALQRATLIGALKCVDEVYIHDSEDSDVSGALEKLRPDIFANGGDRTNFNVPEYKICDELNIQMAFNVGGGKAESSSELVDRAKTRFYPKPWGGYKILDQGNGWTLKTLYVNSNEETSLQSHKERDELWVCVEGSATDESGQEIRPDAANLVWVERGEKHRLKGGPEGAVIVEVMYGRYDEGDIISYEDKHGRI